MDKLRFAINKALSGMTKWSQPRVVIDNNGRVEVQRLWRAGDRPTTGEYTTVEVYEGVGAFLDVYGEDNG